MEITSADVEKDEEEGRDRQMSEAGNTEEAAQASILSLLVVNDLYKEEKLPLSSSSLFLLIHLSSIINFIKSFICLFINNSALNGVSPFMCVFSRKVERAGYTWEDNISVHLSTLPSSSSLKLKIEKGCNKPTAGCLAFDVLLLCSSMLAPAALHLQLCFNYF